MVSGGTGDNLAIKTFSCLLLLRLDSCFVSATAFYIDIFRKANIIKKGSDYRCTAVNGTESEREQSRMFSLALAGRESLCCADNEERERGWTMV